MKMINNFTYPTFMGMCTLLAACADILQNPNIFIGILIGLFGLGSLALIVPEERVPVKLPELFGYDASIHKLLRPFGMSCLILGGIVYAFSVMSAEAEADGGALARVFPEVEKIQVALGRVEKELGELKKESVAIKQDTEQLVDTVVKWISIDVALNGQAFTTASGEQHYRPGSFYVNFANETGQTFEDVELLVSEGSEKLIYDTVKILPQDGYKHNLHADDGKARERVTVCLAAKRRDRSEWVQEHRVYQAKQAQPTDQPDFELVDASGQRVLQQKPSCAA